MRSTGCLGSSIVHLLMIPCYRLRGKLPRQSVDLIRVRPNSLYTLTLVTLPPNSDPVRALGLGRDRDRTTPGFPETRLLERM